MGTSSYLKILSFTIVMFVLCYLIKSFHKKCKPLGLNEGEVCRIGQGSEPDYVCTHQDICESSKDTTKDEHFDICSYEGSSKIICCPPNIDVVPFLNFPIEKIPNVTEKKCLEYKEEVKKFTDVKPFEIKSQRLKNMNIKQCHFKNNCKYSIEDYNTTMYNSAEISHLVLLGYGMQANKAIWECEGSLVSERWILSAAQCQKINFENTVHWAHIGALNIKTRSENNRHKYYRIVDHVIHPEYKPSSLYNDIALFRLEKNVTFSLNMRPTCLNWDPLSNPRVQIATRWSKISTNSTSAELLKIHLNTFPEGQCNTSYFSSNGEQLTQFGVLDDKMMCAVSIDDENNALSIGYIGGPLQVMISENPIMFMQFGITSLSKFSGDNHVPYLFTKISKYILWIESIVWP